MNPETEFRDGLDDLAIHYKEILKILGEDPEREGLRKNTNACCESNADPYPRIYTGSA
jgi:GTP cyclohydrolase I